MLDNTHCANCNRTIDGTEQKYCPHCGQPTPAHRIDWHFLGHELEHSLLHMDRGVLFTLKHLLLRPGHMMRDYIEGRRQGIVKPFLLLMMVSAAMVLLGKYLLAGDLIGSVVTIHAGESPPKMIDGTFDTAFLLTTVTAIKDWINQHYTLVTLLLIPFHSFGFRLAFLREKSVNYPEWLVITTFLTAQSFVLLTLVMPLQRVYPVMQPIAVLVAIIYVVASLAQYFADRMPAWKAAVRALLGYMLYLAATYLVTFIVAIVVGVLSIR
ncbi:MAG: DUF3667 domain-containing protein [Pseudomonadota bacterium]|nr:DUF3667 domain-containing protein [Pseudomonadota bacterium]